MLITPISLAHVHNREELQPMNNPEEPCLYPLQKRPKLNTADQPEGGCAVNLTKPLFGGEMDSASHSPNYVSSPFAVEVLEIILAQLPLSQLYCKCRLVCHLWNDIIQQEKVRRNAFFPLWFGFRA